MYSDLPYNIAEYFAVISGIHGDDDWGRNATASLIGEWYIDQCEPKPYWYPSTCHICLTYDGQFAGI